MKLSAKLPGIVHYPFATRERHADRPRERKRTFELRDAAVEVKRALDLSRQRMIRRIDAEPDLESAVVVDVITRDTVPVRLVADVKDAFALERSEEGADVAVERELLQHEARARNRIAEGDAAIFDVE